MKPFPKVAARIAVASAVWLAVFCLPVVPVLEAPVVPNPSFEWALVSLIQLIASPYLMGITLRATWMTFPAMFGLLLVAFFAARRLNRRIFGAPQAAK
ncbi:MAG TPA: hypothetical protein VHC19_13660 [Pirellulales bacterium]|nr:hypothetical protein [Pirellulales bacterium]